MKEVSITANLDEMDCRFKKAGLADRGFPVQMMPKSNWSRTMDVMIEGDTPFSSESIKQ